MLVLFYMNDTARQSLYHSIQRKKTFIAFCSVQGQWPPRAAGRRTERPAGVPQGAGSLPQVAPGGRDHRQRAGRRLPEGGLVTGLRPRQRAQTTAGGRNLCLSVPQVGVIISMSSRISAEVNPHVCQWEGMLRGVWTRVHIEFSSLLPGSLCVCSCDPHLMLFDCIVKGDVRFTLILILCKEWYQWWADNSVAISQLITSWIDAAWQNRFTPQKNKTHSCSESFHSEKSSTKSFNAPELVSHPCLRRMSKRPRHNCLEQKRDLLRTPGGALTYRLN